MPAFQRARLAPGEMTTLSDAPPICLSNIDQLSLTTECTYSRNTKPPLLIHVRSSYDGFNYDTADLYTLTEDLEPGQLPRKTFTMNTKVNFIAILTENIDESESVSHILITATLGG